MSTQHLPVKEKIMAIPNELLGRYECIEPSINAKRVWHIIHDMSRDIYIVSYGRMGGTAKNIEYEEKRALREIKNKMRRTSKRPPYVKVAGYQEEDGSLAINFIVSLAREVK